MRQQYQNPPIREVVCEFRFLEDGRWDGAAPGLVYSALRAEFPRRWADETPGASAPPGAGSSNLIPPGLQQVELRIGPQEALRFWRESDEAGYFIVGPYRLAVRHFKPYPSWENMREIIGKGVQAYRDVLEPTQVQRIGLRFINAIDLSPFDGPLQVEEFFDFYPFVGHDIPQQLSRFHCLVQMDFENRRDSLILQTATAPGTGGKMEVILDLDYYLMQPDNFDLNDIPEWLETAHDNVERVFEGCLKESTRRLFQ